MSNREHQSDILMMLARANNAPPPQQQQNSVAAFFQQAQAADRNMRNNQSSQSIGSVEQIENQLRQKNDKKSQDSNNPQLAVFFNNNKVNGAKSHAKSQPKEKATNGTMPPPGFKMETKLITPEMLKTSNNSSKPAPTQQTPLTKSQLMQALNHLMDNDEEFVSKVHDAYLKSFKSNAKN